MQYQQYKERIQDIQYIFNSGIEDLTDLQYILVLLYQSINNPSFDLKEEIKSVLNRSKIKNGFETNDINDINYYYYIINIIKADLNNFGSLQQSTNQLLVNILTELDHVLSSEEKHDEPVIVESKVEEQCIGNCSACGIQCHTTAIENINTIKNNSFEEKISNNVNKYLNNNDILDIKNLNINYLKEYLINHNILQNECRICGLSKWQNSHLKLELDFIDGDSYNRNISNIRLLCPNCFSQVGYK